MRKREDCPFFMFVHNPKSRKRTGAMTCTHPSPNIGKSYTGRFQNIEKYCVEGDYISQSHSLKCRILTIAIKKGSVHLQKSLEEYT